MSKYQVPHGSQPHPPNAPPYPLGRAPKGVERRSLALPHPFGRAPNEFGAGWAPYPRWAGGSVLYQPPWSSGFGSQTRGTRENRRTLSLALPFSPPPSFTQSPFPPRSLVRDGQTSPHKPRLVVPHSTCLPLSPSCVTGDAVL